MKFTKIICGILAAVVLLFAVAYTAIVLWIAPGMIKKEILSSVDESCASCHLEIGAVSLAFLNPLDITVSDIKSKLGRFGGSEGLVRVDSIRTIVNFNASTKKNVIVDSIEINGPDIMFVDGDASSKKTDSKEESGPTFTIRETKIEDGKFTYTRNTKGTSGTLHISGLKGEIGPIGTSEDIKKDMVNAHLRGRLEKSGEIEVDVATLLREGPDHVDVAVSIHDQNLEDVNPFFTANAGVELKGKIEKARGRVLIRDQEAAAIVWIVYHGLSVKLSPMYDRSEFTAFLMSLGADLVMKEDDIGLSKETQTKALKVKREPNERIVGYILRSLKEAAIKLAQEASPQKEEREKAKTPLSRAAEAAPKTSPNEPLK